MYRVATLIPCVGVEALERHNGLPFKSDKERQNMEVILKTLAYAGFYATGVLRGAER